MDNTGVWNAGIDDKNGVLIPVLQTPGLSEVQLLQTQIKSPKSTPKRYFGLKVAFLRFLHNGKKCGAKSKFLFNKN